MGETARELARRKADDVIWRTASLAMPVDYAAAWGVWHQGYGIRGHPVAETVLLYSLSRVWSLLLERCGGPLDAALAERYARMLPAAPAPLPPASGDAEDDALAALAALWAHDRLLAAVCANHILVHGGVGLFAPAPERSLELEDAARGGYLRAWARECAVQLAPGGLTREGRRERAVR